MKLVYAVLLVLFMTTAGTCEELSFFDKHEVSIGYSFYTKHLNNEEDLNEINHVMALSVDQWSFMTFKNSHYIRSWFLGYDFRTRKYDPFNTMFYARANLYLGALFGYGEYMPDIYGWTIGAVPTIELGYKNIALETMICPVNGGVITSGIKLTF